MRSLAPGFRAAVLGASGGIGSAIADRLAGMPGCSEVVRLSRRSDPPLDYDRPETIEAAARAAGPLRLVVIATGALRVEGHAAPEKRLADLDDATLAASFRVNAIGPALALRYFAPTLPRNERTLIGVLSARIGSIGDNRLGGWYAYRASKAALNQIVRTAAIELARSHPDAVLAALHPGTVRTRLSAPHVGDRATAPEVAAEKLLAVLDAARESGAFLDYEGRMVMW